MPLYEAKRAVIGTLPDLVLNPPPTLSALLDDFELQLGQTVMKGMICNIMQYTSKSFLLHLASPEQVQELVANGLTFRSHPVHIEPCRSITNVTLERVPYGLPGSTVMSALRPYGNCKGARPVTHKGFGISKLIVEIEMTKDIPSRIYIQGNPINVFYRNQPRSCFVCSEKGHEAKSCPKKRAKKRPADASSTAATDPGDKRVCNTVLPTFANVVSGASPSVLPPVPSVTTAPLPSGPPVDVVTDQPPVVVQEIFPVTGTDGASSVDPPLLGIYPPTNHSLWYRKFFLVMVLMVPLLLMGMMLLLWIPPSLPLLLPLVLSVTLTLATPPQLCLRWQTLNPMLPTALPSRCLPTLSPTSWPNPPRISSLAPPPPPRCQLVPPITLRICFPKVSRPPLEEVFLHVVLVALKSSPLDAGSPYVLMLVLVK